MNEESVAIFLEEHKVKAQLKEVLVQQEAVKSQLTEIAEQLRLIREERRVESTQAYRTNRTSPPFRPQPSPAKPCMSHTPSKVAVGQTVQNATEDPERSMTFADVVRNPVPKGYTLEADGFMTRRTHTPQRNGGKVRSQRPLVIGVKSRNKLKPTVNDVRIFASKFNPEENAADIEAYILEQLGAECSVERIASRTTRHSSFLITASKKYEKALLDPNTWEEGVQVRHFYGRLKSTHSA